MINVIAVVHYYCSLFFVCVPVSHCVWPRRLRPSDLTFGNYRKYSSHHAETESVLNVELHYFRPKPNVCRNYSFLHIQRRNRNSVDLWLVDLVILMLVVISVMFSSVVSCLQTIWSYYHRLLLVCSICYYWCLHWIWICFQHYFIQKAWS